MRRFSSNSLSSCALALLMATGVASEATAQVDRTPYMGAKNRFGLLGGFNVNMVGAGQMQLPNSNQTAFNQFVLNDGMGFGPYAGIMYEYNSGGLLGFQARATYDDRRATLKDDSQGLTLNERLAYINVEPALRLNLGEPNFHMVLGPSIAFAMNKGFDYTVGGTSSSGEFNNINAITYGLWGGLGYDILLSNMSSPTRWYLAPFVEGSWMFDQAQSPVADNNFTDGKDNIDDKLSTVTIRAGVQLKFGSAPVIAPVTATVTEPAPSMDISLRAPETLTANRSLEETFPLRNYVFFDQGSSTLPSRYVRLDNGQAMNFSETSMMDIPSAGVNSTDRSARQMNVYYNGLNIFASRLKANPSAMITLNGAGSDVNEGLKMATEVKNYMVSTFGIPENRIAVKGSTIPVNQSGTSSTPREDLALVGQENRRVEILSDNQEILKPVMIRSVQTASGAIENDLVLNVNANQDIDNWRVVIEGEGTSEVYGPFSRTTQRIGADPILKDRQSGTYTARVVATTRNGQTITRETPFQLARNTESQASGAQRYSILFEYDDSKTVQTYESFLRNEVAPKVPDGATVYIHGHTDRIGLDDHNLDLSARRATEARNVLQNELNRLGKTVTFDTYGYGEADNHAPFTNDRPEGRYYNRTVVMEVVPR